MSNYFAYASIPISTSTHIIRIFIDTNIYCVIYVHINICTHKSQQPAGKGIKRKYICTFKPYTYICIQASAVLAAISKTGSEIYGQIINVAPDEPMALDEYALGIAELMQMDE